MIDKKTLDEKTFGLSLLLDGELIHCYKKTENKENAKRVAKNVFDLLNDKTIKEMIINLKVDEQKYVFNMVYDALKAYLKYDVLDKRFDKLFGLYIVLADLLL